MCRANRYLRTERQVETAISAVLPGQPQSALKTFIDSLRWEEIRQQQLSQIQIAIRDQEDGADTNATVRVISEEVQTINRNLVASATGLSLAVIGLLYSPLALLSIPFTLYASVDVLREAKDALLEERRLCHSVLDATVILSALASRYYLASALASLTY
ncbi:MAG: hypothetical protein R3E79_60175 [Caldilineaceae bacterium]